MPDPVPPSDDFFNQFLDDYFAECEEYLAVVRRDLLNIERFVGQTDIDSAQLDELFRSFHTMKGISGMVGLPAAEQLSHEMEDYLRVLREGNTQLNKKGFEALVEGTRVLGEVIDAHRTHLPIPDIQKSIEALQTATSVRNAKKSTASYSDPESKDLMSDEWRFLFVPTQARSDAGINVNSVRARLQSLGEITRTTPLVEKGDVVFEFIVSTTASEAELEDLNDLGLTRSPVNQESETVLESATTPTSSSTPSTQTHASSVRVDLVRLDQLMLLVGELVVTRARLEQNLNSVRASVSAADWRSLQEVNVTFGKQLRDLRNDVMRVRMVPISEVFERMRFVVRNIARETQKRVHLDLSGQETEIDKFLVERLMDPLLHLVRNSISHGIESEAERLSAGKSAVGQIFISAKTAGELVIIEIGDDGRGIDVESVQSSSGIQLTSADGEVNFSDLLKIISTPGFSTRKEVDRASGRGVGMDVVAKAIEELDGELSVHTERGVGTTFRIELPLTLAITDALIATVAGQTFAIHRSSVYEVIEIDPSAIKVLENNEIILHREEVLPLIRLSRVFKLPDKREGVLHAFIVGSGAHATGLVVDKVVGLREVVVRSLADPLTDVPGVAGATELGDGRPILILDVMEILDASRRISVSQRT